jgi:Uma2 family endonuclease
MGTKTLLTLEEFLALPEDGYKHELNQGELVRLPLPRAIHSLVIQRINRSLSAYVYAQGAGEVLSEAAYLLTREHDGIARQPDVSFLSAGRVNVLDEGCFAGAPELAVEVVSPSNEAEDLDIKINQYLRYGSKEVWVFYPKSRSVLIHRASNQIRKLSDHDTITTDLFPGWSARVADFFDLDY